MKSDICIDSIKLFVKQRHYLFQLVLTDYFEIMSQKTVNRCRVTQKYFLETIIYHELSKQIRVTQRVTWMEMFLLLSF